jgi:hypothetical protein
MATNHDPIRLTDEQMQLLSQWCAQTGKSVDQVLADALHSYRPSKIPSVNVSSGETFLDRLTRHGLLGCLSGGPPDLSTNPDHMKGFGE